MNYYRFNRLLIPAVSQQVVAKQLLCYENFEESDRILGCSQGRGTTWLLRTREFPVDCVLRHYYRGGLWGKIVTDCYFLKNVDSARSMQEFDLLMKLSEWGLPVPRPIGAKIKKTFCFYQADILLEKIPNTLDLSQYLQHYPLNHAQYQQIGRVIRQLHQHQVHHSDLNIHNILLDKQGKIWLIDFDKCKIEEGENWKSANLKRLHRSFCKEKRRLKIHFQPSDWQALLAGYHQEKS